MLLIRAVHGFSLIQIPSRLSGREWIGQVTRHTNASDIVTDTVALASPSDAGDVDPEQDDNITNFASGRLDTVFE